MSKLMLWLCAVFCCVLLGNCRPTSANSSDRELRLLVSYLSGSFNSKAQALRDSSFYEIHLNMKPIWQERGIGYWLYVEQAHAETLDKPYRQRVYNVYRRNDTFVSDVYTLHNAMRFAGAHRRAHPLEALTPDSLVAREGCAIILRRTLDGFSGATKPNTCPSDLRGAAYATSEVELSPKKLLSWDRGFDTNGQQVWGAVKGGYVFDKTAQY